MESEDCHVDPIIDMLRRMPDEYAVIKAYTSNVDFGGKKFYAYVNNSLCKDDRNSLQYLMPFIRRTTYFINYQGPQTNQKVFRGMKLNDQQKSFFYRGCIFRFPGFTSTSQKENVAALFGNTVFEIEILAGCPQVRDIQRFSTYYKEKEWLFVPYSCFVVTANDGKRIKIRALDNLMPYPIQLYGNHYGAS